MMAFLTLPAEIREAIYFRMFQDTALCFLKSTTNTEEDNFICRSMRDIQLSRPQLQAAARDTPNILLTCRTCYNEARLIFASTITLVVFDHRHLTARSYFKRVSQITITNIQAIQLHSWNFPLRTGLSLCRSIFTSIRIVETGKFWSHKLSHRPDLPQLLHNSRNNPRVDKKLMRVTTAGDLADLMVPFSNPHDNAYNVFMTFVCKAIYPRSRNGPHCHQCHGYILHYWTMLVNKKKVFRCFSTKLDIRIARAVLLGDMTPEETGLLEPRPQTCLLEPGIHQRRRSRVFDMDNVADTEILNWTTVGAR